MKRKFSLSKLFKSKPKVARKIVNVPRKKKFTKSEIEEMIKSGKLNPKDRKHIEYDNFSREIYEKEANKK